VWYLSRYLDDGDATVSFGSRDPRAIALNPWVRIAPDGVVTCGVHRAEMGQGVTTGLPMLLAEELDLDWRAVRFEFTPVDRDYFNFGVLLRGQPLGDTAGRPLAQLAERLIRGSFHALGLSMTISSTSAVDAWDSLRVAGAAARILLVRAAARRWGVPAESLSTASGRVHDPASGRALGYGELAPDAARETPPDEVPLRDPAAFRLVGTSPPRLDVPAKVTGAAAFGIDTVAPGMLFAAVRHSPLLGTRVAAVDNAAEVSGMPGVEGVVRLGDRAVAVVAGNTWSALRAAARLSLKPEPTDAVSADSAALITAWRSALDDPDPAVFADEGEPLAVLAGQAGIEAVYELPYLAHACMEPMNCTALVTAEAVTVWAPTQAESIARDVAAEMAGIDSDRVTLHRTFLGGGFGRRAEMDFVKHAVLAAQAFPGRPVKLTYSREEDLQADMYRPAAVVRVRGALDPAGRVSALDYVLVSQSVTASYFARTPTPRGGDARKDQSALSGAVNLVYGGISRRRFAFVPQDVPVPVGFWRSVGNSHNGFVVESFVDELAARAASDPVEFRLAHLRGQPRHQAVLRAAAQRAGWGEPLAAGRGRGISLIESHDSIVAQVIEVTTAAGRLASVDRVVCVIDPRIVIHPDIVVAQMQSAIIDGLSAALYGRVTIRGAVEQRNLADYRLLRLAEAPVIEVHLLPQGGRPGGVGEPGLAGVAPALVNAICNATGQRIRRLPLLV
jgi:isoquinoline 1-oxidoreductase beta subunit